MILCTHSFIVYVVYNNNNTVRNGLQSLKCHKDEPRGIERTLKKASQPTKVNYLTGLMKDQGFTFAIKTIGHEYTHLKPSEKQWTKSDSLKIIRMMYFV